MPQLFSFQNIDEIVLHIDINGTIIAEDKAGGETTSDFIEKLVERAKSQGFIVEDSILSIIKQKLATREECATVFIFPSLFNLIDKLDVEKVSYRVIFRTFGSDIPDITAEIRRQRPDIEFSHIDFKQHACDAATQREMLATRYLNAQWLTVQENYEYWELHGRTAQAGKQLCLNKNPRILDVFFDDCVKRKDLIHVVDSNGSTMDKSEAIARGHLVAVDTLKAIYDDEYFIKELVKAMIKYSDSLQLEPLHLLKLSV